MNEVDWDEFGGLESATAHHEDGMWIALTLSFGAGRVRFDTIGDDDTIAVQQLLDENLPEHLVPAGEIDVSARAPWSDVLGQRVVWARSMTNHHGYEDGFQLEFSCGESAVGDCIELVVVASELVLGTAKFLPHHLPGSAT